MKNLLIMLLITGFLSGCVNDLDSQEEPVNNTANTDPDFGDTFDKTTALNIKYRNDGFSYNELSDAELDGSLMWAYDCYYNFAGAYIEELYPSVLPFTPDITVISSMETPELTEYAYYPRSRVILVLDPDSPYSTTQPLLYLRAMMLNYFFQEYFNTTDTPVIGYLLATC